MKGGNVFLEKEIDVIIQLSLEMFSAIEILISWLFHFFQTNLLRGYTYPQDLIKWLIFNSFMENGTGYLKNVLCSLFITLRNLFA